MFRTDYVAWSAVKQIQDSDKIPLQYKIALQISSALIGVGMIAKGSDIFASNVNKEKTLEAVKFTAKLLDTTIQITRLEEEFNKGYISGCIYAAQNIKALLANKFILNTTKSEILNIFELVITQKLFAYLPSGTHAALLASKEAKPYLFFLKLASYKAAQYILSSSTNLIKAKLKNSVEIDIKKHIAELLLSEDNTQKLITLGDKANALNNNILSNYNTASSGISNILQSSITPFVIPSSSQVGVPIQIVNTNFSLFLLDSLFGNIFDFKNLEYIKKFLESKINLLESRIFKSKANDLAEDSEAITIEIPGSSGKIYTNVTQEAYTYKNIQEIAKLCGNNFMLNKIITSIEMKGNSTKNIKLQSLNTFTELAQDLIKQFLYITVFQLQNITTSEQLLLIEQDLLKLKTLLGFNSSTPSYGQASISINEIEEILRFLSEPYQNTIEYGLNADMTLTLKDYHLKVKDKANDMLAIPSLKFKSQNIYAITGKIGTGKTTLLTDIAKCLVPAFSSTGEIFYPGYAGHSAHEIFCGITPFSPPATTLFERLTYRLPNKIIEQNKEKLATYIVKLFEKFGQTGFEEKLFKKENNDKLSLSTGQSKITLIIGAILYKAYLNEPVLLILDETLANLDEDTSNLVCSEIKKIFKDSIVISVDHNARHNTTFYDEYVDLAAYHINDSAVAVQGSDSLESDMKIEVD